ncbi:roadblock/LC7 domain-containing protein [Nocardia amikacinitolerans]|uniref:Predicted regulator of Ras-like GTPase activity, Roadblock/LC7/MglB family n=1 Tax=Nocardia amikacinitolerans TaxID=756689 RepID=A0A285KPT6_9NOCA|nr:roadblock/LC7 domain-containing protein [Nocardia amikacinitolerans]MCP2275459.1 putative regulator of Ras-like GTPase activity, Roadblock/LC7/MglB family [Nocardia amikacinitolerans]MCP2288669.1 putative regulator of Ras-like GTPase activity, Roadblock/LC7/MglB family [Nocardia amikacinitolerans]MCP2293719.1 putative regulator of Ras-like GTPase activity, Roadblock/LC7/MglB family [Nocardia amikacinitolerans]MCP2315368.1 putative regulator of Ras-like GTPase activity, Roadblock/LC7/MglB fam
MGTPTTAVADSSNKLGWLLEDLSIPGVRFAVLLSDDGLRIAHSKGIARDDAERFAAAASGLRSLGKALGEFCGGPETGLRQNMTEYDDGMIFITAAGEGALLGVSTTADIDVSLIAHRMNELAGRVGHELGSQSRQRTDSSLS